MWISDIETKVLAKLKENGEVLKKNFPNIVFTTENESDTPAKFPTVCLEELSGMERGRDLEGIKVNAYMATFQINITHNDRRYHVKSVMNNCMKTMKELRFEIIGTPVYSRSDGVWTGVARFRRTIGANDTL